MANLRRQHAVLAMILVSAVAWGAGCSQSGNDAGPASAAPVVGDEEVLEGVQFDVRRDPG